MVGVSGLCTQSKARLTLLPWIRSKARHKVLRHKAKHDQVRLEALTLLNIVVIFLFEFSLRVQNCQLPELINIGRIVKVKV